MSIVFKKGDLFAEPAEALVNTVNCVGVMGKGVALEFKKRWPANFTEYKALCEKKHLRPGTLHIHEVNDMFGLRGPKFIINFPTKDHWRAQSKIEFIESGLDALIDTLLRYHISSVAIPPLGCGNGGLSWEDVEPIIRRKLGNLIGTRVTVLEPTSAQDRVEHRSMGVAMTYPRAVLLKALGDLEALFDGMFDRISLQKLVYLLQALGVSFELSFERNLFGPYSEALRRAFAALERYEMLAGFTSDSRLTKVTPAGYAMADEYLNNTNQSDAAQDAVERLSRLIEGYEGPYGLELLSSVHHIVIDDKMDDANSVVAAMGAWSDAKRNKFSPTVIRGAYARLQDDGLI